ncbi:8831_t:CDS:2, partial [Racocetra persica]
GEMAPRQVVVNKKVIQSVFDQKREEISSLKEQLNDLLKNVDEEKTVESPDSSFDNEAEFTQVTKEEKQATITYLNNLIIEVAKNGKGDYSSLSSEKFILKRELKDYQKKVLRDDERANYEEKINNANNKEKVHKLRQVVIDEIIYYVNDLKGGSGRPLEVAEIKNSFSDLISKETSYESEVNDNFNNQQYVGTERRENQEREASATPESSVDENSHQLKKSFEASEVNGEFFADKSSENNINQSSNESSQETESIHQQKTSEPFSINSEETTSEQHQVNNSLVNENNESEQNGAEKQSELLRQKEKEQRRLVIKSSNNPEEISLDNISYENLGNDYTLEKLETAKKSRREILEKEKLTREKEAKKREVQEQKKQEKIKDYEELLKNIKTASDLASLQKFSNQINTFVCDGLSEDKTNKVLETAYSQLQTELQKQAAAGEYDALSRQINEENDSIDEEKKRIAAEASKDAKKEETERLLREENERKEKEHLEREEIHQILAKKKNEEIIKLRDEFVESIKEAKIKEQGVLKGDWQKRLRDEADKGEIDREKERLKSLIDKAKEEDNKIRQIGNSAVKADQLIKSIKELVQQQNNAIDKEEGQNFGGLIDGKTQEGKRVLPIDWKDSIKEKNGIEEINKRAEELKTLIDQFIEKEATQQNTSGTRKKDPKENELNKNLKTLLSGEATGKSGIGVLVGRLGGNYKKDVEK